MAELLTHPIVYLYDGSFEGFLSGVFEAFRLKIPVAAFEAQSRHAPELFTEIQMVSTNPSHAERVWDAMGKRDSPLAAMVRGTFLSELPGMETILWRFLQKFFADPSGSHARNVLDPDVYQVYETARKVRAEAHRFLGFVRFEVCPNGDLLALVDPEYNIVELIAPHFMKRLPRQSWCILDTGRRTGIQYHHGKSESISIATPLPRNANALSKALDPEDEYRRLWRHYYESINITERANPGLMVRCLPRKYWKYLPEKNQSLATKERLTGMKLS
ncbi:MAG TPA: TIGR03915 family putative DNA repair protein [Fibrobacteraceae bacterium]|nr:TIGR03915 family putative DNA repair protein [Fibrobacteraceae bacterium]